MKLYYAPRTCALAVHLALEHIGARYEAIRVDFGNNEQRGEDFLKVNPKGRVPVLVTRDGTLTETPAILAYLCQTHPEANLAPVRNPFRFARLQSFNSYLCATVHVAHAHAYRGYRWTDDEAAIESMKKKVPQSMGECMALIENEMFRGPWVFGDVYTVSDMYLFTISEWLEMDGVDTTKLPKIMDHRARMLQDPVVQRVLAAEQGPSPV